MNKVPTDLMQGLNLNGKNIELINTYFLNVKLHFEYALCINVMLFKYLVYRYILSA